MDCSQLDTVREQSASLVNNYRSFDNRHVRIPFRSGKYFPMSVIGSPLPKIRLPFVFLQKSSYY